MRKITKLTLGAGLALTTLSANAVIIDFIDLIENKGYGESAWTELKIDLGDFDVTITGTASDDDDDQQYAYLDWGTAGLGVCKDLIDPGTADKQNPGSSKNLCGPSSDDNVTTNEALHFVFSEDVIVDYLWFNNNHDGGFGLGDQVIVAEMAHDVTLGYADGTGGLGPFEVPKGVSLDVLFKNEQFYISGSESRPGSPPAAVPEPASLTLFGAGLIGLAGGVRRRAKRQTAARIA